MKTTKCAFHVGQNIVNFCRNSECLLPMCPKCIKIHSIEHINEKTQGMFDNINEVTQEIQSNLSHNLRNMIGLSNLLKSTMQKKFMSEEQIKRNLNQSKNKIIQGIIQYLNVAQAQALKTIKKQMYNINEEFKQIDNKISGLAENLKSQIQGMQGDNKMKTVINYFSAKMPIAYQREADTVHSLISQLQYKSLSKSKDLNLNNIQQILSQLKKQFTGSITVISQDNFSIQINPETGTARETIYTLTHKDIGSQKSTQKKTQTASSLYSGFYR